jgi:hypothetical protein
MTDQQHPIIPPSKLFKQWEDDILNERDNVDYVLDCAWRNGFQAGADQELEACCEVLDNLNDGFWSEKLRAARRSKPPSLKQQALKKLAWVGEHLDMPLHNYCNAIHTIQRALEQIDD